MMNQFCYKWYFISAQQDNVAVKKTGWEYDQAIHVFLFHELDRLDYDLFSVNGFEIVLKKKPKSLRPPKR
jgi:hypothetical protein